MTSKNGQAAFFRPTTKVLMADEKWKRISSIKRGMNLITYKGDFSIGTIKSVKIAYEEKAPNDYLCYCDGLKYSGQDAFMCKDPHRASSRLSIEKIEEERCRWLDMRDLDYDGSLGLNWIRPNSNKVWGDAFFSLDGFVERRAGRKHLLYSIELEDSDNFVVTTEGGIDHGIVTKAGPPFYPVPWHKEL